MPTVRDVGEYAVRGGILDLFAPGADEPLRLDFFGDTLETIRTFDPASQRTSSQKTEFSMQPMSEITLSPEIISHFRTQYVLKFGAPSRDDALYQSISEGRRFAGMEHWLPLFYEKLETVFDHAGNMPVVFDHLAHESMAERHKLVLDHYEARRRQSDGKEPGDAVPYKPVEPGALYLTPEQVEAGAVSSGMRLDFTPFDAPFVSGGPSYMPVHIAGVRSLKSARRRMRMFSTVWSGTLLTNAPQARRFWWPRGARAPATGWYRY